MSNQEGELKKKIIKWASNLSDEVDLNHKWFDGKAQRSDKMDFEQILNEAKAEFDAIEKEFFPTGDIPHNVSAVDAELKYWVPRERKLQEWFKRWFGGV